MLCCGRQQGNKDPIADIDRLIIKDLEKKGSGLNFCQKLTKKYKLEVQWSYVDTTSSLQSFSIAKKTKQGNHPDSKRMCLFRTEFTNKTGLPQKYTFKTERQTKSIAKVAIQKGFTIGGSLNCSFGLPSEKAPKIDPLNIAGNLSGTLQMTKTKEETFEENLLWSVDSPVEVQSKHKTTASLIIEEEKATATFEVRHHIVPKEIHIPVFVVHKGTGKVVHSYDYPSANLYKVLKKIPGCEKLDKNGVELVTSGVCDVCYGAKQIISIKEQPYVATQESIIRDDMLPSLDELVAPSSFTALTQPFSTSVNGSKPQSASIQPQSTTIQPPATTAKPQSTTNQPQASTAKPQSTTTQPHAITAKPQSTTTKPQSTTNQPQATTAKPQSTSAQLAGTTGLPLTSLASGSPKSSATRDTSRVSDVSQVLASPSDEDVKKPLLKKQAGMQSE